MSQSHAMPARPARRGGWLDPWRARSLLCVGLLILACLILAGQRQARAAVLVEASYTDSGYSALTTGHGDGTAALAINGGSAFVIANPLPDSLCTHTWEHRFNDSEPRVGSAASLLAKRPTRIQKIPPTRPLDLLGRPLFSGQGRILEDVRAVDTVWPFSLRQ